MFLTLVSFHPCLSFWVSLSRVTLTNDRQRESDTGQVGTRVGVDEGV